GRGFVMNRGIIYYDRRSGKLVEGVVWEFDFQFVKFLNAFEDIDWEKNITYAEWTGHGITRELKDCPTNKKHVTGLEYLKICIDLRGGKHLTDFVPIDCQPYPIISERFAARLKESRLTGYKVRPIISVEVNQVHRFPTPKLYYLDFVGKGGRAHR